VEPYDIPDSLLLVATGTITFQELLDAMVTHRFGENRLWPFVLDLSRATMNLSSEEIRSLAQTVGAASRTSPVGPVAIVASEELVFGLGRMFQTYSDLQGRSHVGVFRSRDEARSWLSSVDS
jgi:hypothetical protein